MMNDYSKFLELKKALDAAGVDYRADIDLLLPKIKKRERGEQFSLRDHVEGLIYAELSSQRPWEPIARNKHNIDAIFGNFEPTLLKETKPDYLVDRLKKIKCGNRQIRSQMNTLRNNIETLEHIETDYGSIDNFYNSLPPEELVNCLSNSTSKYKLNGLGVALTSEYLKNMGIKIEKPDVHVCRILANWGYSKHNPATPEEAHQICSSIAEKYGITIVEVDAIIWRGGQSGVAYKG